MPLRTWRFYAATAVAILAIVATAVTLWRGSGRASGPPSVAVLPFEGPGADAAYFTAGFHDAVISQLARIQGLKVISRFSVLAYGNGPRDHAKIAHELGVKHLVEGSVQRAGERLNVTARLIVGGSGKELWSAEYDRAPGDIFPVQADMARQIARAIDARLTVEEEARLDQAPTKDLGAYELYLRALDAEQRSSADKAALTQALGWLDEAIAKDPGFALAHAQASRVHMTIYWVVGEYDKARLPKAHEHARRAIELAPNLAEPHLAMALYWYWGNRDYDNALDSLGDALALEPNSAAVSFLTGSIYRRLARWDVSISAARRAALLDPRNARNLQVYADVLSANRHFKDADDVLAKLASVAPRSPLAFLMRLQNQERWTGGVGDAPVDFTRFEAREDPYCLARLAEHELQMLQRKFTEAAATILACPSDAIGALHNVPSPKHQFAAIAEHFAGNATGATAHAEVARAALGKRLGERPDLPLSRIALAQMLAILGDKAGAMAEADRAVADAPMTKDAIVAAELRDQVAALHAHLGEHDRALAELADTLTMAYGSYAPLVQLNPFWDGLRDDARFKKLVAGNLPKDD